MFLRALLLVAVCSANGLTFADPPPEVAAPPARRPEIGAAGKAAVMEFRLKNYVGKDLAIGDGYVDGGHGMTIHPDGKVTSGREILSVDRKRDAELQKHLAYARSAELEKLDELDRATRLARYVAALFTPPEGRKALEKNTRVLENTYRNQEVLIGDVPRITKSAGVCRHRALMFKLLADEAGLKVALVRGLYGRDPAKAGYHAWNELFLDGGTMVIVDTTNPQPDFHFPTLDSKQAPRYLTPARQPKYQPEAKSPQKPPADPQPKETTNQVGRPTLSVPIPKTPPRIDGVLDDDCWNAALPVTLGYSIGTWWDAPTQKTEARVLADKTNIYIGVRCFEAEPERMVAAGTATGGMVLGADAVEFFLDPGYHQKRFDYYHVIVTPNGSIYRAKGLDPEGWKGAVTAKVGKFAAGWTVEAAIPFAELGMQDGAIPDTWGLNICRQRPELGYEMPKAARDAGNKRFDPPLWKLDDPKKYRLAEFTCWSPTMADFCGWPFYSDSRPFHFAQHFGRARLEAGTRPVMRRDGPPFEVIFKSDFDNGKIDPFQNAVLRDDNFRGPGKSLGFAEGQNMIRLPLPLEDLEDVTMLLTLKMPQVDAKTSPGWNKGPLFHQRLSVFGEAPDGRRCGPERYEIFLTPEIAAARTKTIEEAHQQQFGGGTFELYDTHADMVRWKPCGRVRKGPGPWAMVEGFFAEPSPGQVRWPGKDWAIVRLRLGTFRREPGPNQGQRLVPREQNYPKGLIFTALARDDVRIDDVVIFRGDDHEPPARVNGVKVQRRGADLELSWNRASDNTLTAFYQIYAAKKLVAETHTLTARLKAAEVQGAALSVVAVDLYGNHSAPSETVPIEK